jgi:Gpi18-like mannosyltransferase
VRRSLITVIPGVGQPWIATPLLIFIATRLGLFLFVLGGQLLLPKNNQDSANLALPRLGQLFISGWNEWDSGWYRSIATGGYIYDSSTHAGNVAFFPLYPLLVRLALPLLPNPGVAGIVISNLLLAAAMIVIYQLVTERLGSNAARVTLILLAVFPFAFFYSAVYTESLFLLLSALAFYLAERERWWLAGLVGALAAFSRLVGIALGPVLLLAYLERRRFQWRRLDARILSPALVPLGTLLYASYLLARFRDPLAFYTSSLYGWGRHNVFIALQTGSQGWLDPTLLTPGSYELVLQLNLLIALIWLVMIVPIGRRLGLAYAAFVLICTVVPLSAGLESLGRYLAVLFPVFAVAALYLRHRPVYRLAIAGSAALLGLLAALFATGYWII